MLITIVLNPYVLRANPLIIAGILLPTILFLIYMIKKPQVSKWVKEREFNNLSIDDKYNTKRANEKAEIDRILDKANAKGWEKTTGNKINIIAGCGYDESTGF